MSRDVYVPHREVPAEWQQALEQIVPRSDTIPWLLLRWYPGISYSPIGRWVLYELTPNLDLVHPDWLRDIRGSSPRTRGRWIADPDIPEHLGGQRWASDAMHSTTQWEIFRDTNCYPTLFWIIQGDKGGHVWRLDAVTRNFRLSLDGVDVPNPGELPYAEWDSRVSEQIQRYDRLKQWHARMTQPWTDRSLNKTDAGLWVGKEMWDLEQMYATEMLKFMDNQIEEAVRDIPQRLLPTWSDLPRGDGHYNADADALERRLTEDLSHTPT